MSSFGLIFYVKVDIKHQNLKIKVCYMGFSNENIVFRLQFIIYFAFGWAL